MNRRVVLLETNERPGLVAALSQICQKEGVSIEISTGPGHVLICFEADETITARTCESLKTVPGIHDVFPYSVVSQKDPLHV
jgi:nitrate reductase NapAB chaperone NapD